MGASNNEQINGSRPRKKGIYAGVGLIGVILITSIVWLLLQGTIAGPKVEITSSMLRRGVTLLTRNWIYVDVSLFNHGSGGNVTVWVKITSESTYITGSVIKSCTVYIGPQESKDVTIAFAPDEVPELGEMHYEVWLTY